MEKDSDDDNDYTNTTYNTTLWKYGVNENFELRFITEYLGEQAHKKSFSDPEGSKINNLDSSSSGFNSLAAGAKIRYLQRISFFSAN